MNIIKFLTLSVLIVILAACASATVDDPKVGMNFNSRIWANKTESGVETDDPGNFYIYVGNVTGGVLYAKSPKFPSPFKGGLIVSNGKIVKVLSQEELFQLIDSTEKAAKLKAQQDAKQEKIKSDLAEKKRVDELKSRKYSMMPAKVTVSTRGSAVILTSVDNDAFLLERVLVNNRTGVEACDKSGLTLLMNTGDTRSVNTWGGCGDTIVKVDIYTNRGSFSYAFK